MSEWVRLKVFQEKKNTEKKIQRFAEMWVKKKYNKNDIQKTYLWSFLNMRFGRLRVWGFRWTPKGKYGFQVSVWGFLPMQRTEIPYTSHSGFLGKFSSLHFTILETSTDICTRQPKKSLHFWHIASSKQRTFRHYSLSKMDYLRWSPLKKPVFLKNQLLR